tara:strand:+ start:1469 stop:2083 length:615 start_codon:yes stop_codon:yes gene_type:complete
MTYKGKLPKQQRRIGLTGGIASGKSTISKYISEEKKIKVLDADNYAKQLIIPGKNSYKKIIEHYGPKIINKESIINEINTSKLKNIIFNNHHEKIWLENLLHPLIKNQMANDCLKFKEKTTLILEIPLLFEANFNDLCTEIWLVKCSENIQRERLMQRDKLNKSEAGKLISSQMSNEEKEKRADIVLVNENNINPWKFEVDQLI